MLTLDKVQDVFISKKEKNQETDVYKTLRNMTKSLRAHTHKSKSEIFLYKQHIANSFLPDKKI